jgi:cytochrome P450
MERERHAGLVEALALPLPFAVIAGMLGTPPADHERIRELTGILCAAWSRSPIQPWRRGS